MTSLVQANVTIQGSITSLGTLGQTTFAPVDLGVNSLSLKTGNLTSLITTTASAPAGFAAADEGALVFPGTANAYISFGTTGQPFSNSNIYAFGDFVVEAWVNPANFTAANFIVNFGDAASSLYWYLATGTTTGQLVWYSLLNGASSSAASTASLTTGTWQHIAVIHQSSTKRIQLYINGQPQTFTAASSGGFTMAGTVATYTTGVIPVTGQQLVIGQAGGGAVTASLTNLRVTTGSGAMYLYNNNAFTPSTSPLFPASNVTGGSLTTRLLVRVPLAPGKMVVPKLGGANCNTVLAFPPAPMTGYSTNMTGQSYYGGGVYVASASNDGGHAVWQIFDKNSSTYGQVATSLYTANTPYSGTTRTVDVNGNSYAGEWFQLQMPVSIVLSSYVISGSGSNMPTLFYLLGSRDGTAWSLVDQRTMSSWGTTFSTSSAQAYSYYRIVINMNTGAQPAIYEWTLNGTIEGPTVSPDGKLGVGVSNPVQALEVAGSAVVAGTLSAGNPLMFRNRIINGDMRVFQRGTTFSLSGTSATYTLDRWTQYTASGTTRTVSNVLDVPFRSGFISSANVVATAATTTSEFFLGQKTEMYNVIDFIGSPVTLSFWYKSNRVGNHGVRFNSGGTIPGNADTYQLFTVVNANTWEYKVLTFNTLIQCTVPGPSTWNGDGIVVNIGPVVFNMGSTSIANGDYFTLTGVQLEKGSVATPFEVRPFATELALCQRYMFQMIYQDTAPCYQRTSVLGLFTIRFPVTMRSAVNPTLSGTFNASIGATDTTISSISTPGGGYGASATGSQYMFPSTQTLGNAGHIWINSTTAYIRWDAEL